MWSGAQWRRRRWQHRGMPACSLGLALLHAHAPCPRMPTPHPASRHGKALIADLGLAKILHHERSTVTGNLGTLNWVRAAGGSGKGSAVGRGKGGASLQRAANLCRRPCASPS